MPMELTPKQQTSEAIRQAESILILTGQHPSADQVAAVVALAAILRKFGKTVTAIISDQLPASAQVLDMSGVERSAGGSRDFVLKLDTTKVEVDKLRYETEGGKLNIYLTPYKGNFAPSDVTFDYGVGSLQADLAVVLGVPSRSKIDRIYEQNASAFDQIPIVNLDFHRSNENYGAVNLIEPNASSLCEMLVALSESLQGGIIDADIATALLMGIMASTDRFTASHTSPKSLTVAAQMMAAGAKQQAVVKALYRDGGKQQEQQKGGNPKGSQNQNNQNQGGQRQQQQQPAQRPAESQPRMPQAAAHVTAVVEPPMAAEIKRAPAPAFAPTADPVPAPIVTPATVAEAAAPAPTAPVMEMAPVPAPVAPAPVAEATAALAAAEALESSEVPIIQPGHIEMSPHDAFEQAERLAAAHLSHAQPALAGMEMPAAEPVPVQAEAPQIPGRPQSMPMADFAAAAEMFSSASTADVATQREE
ncbi:MAG TPA: DHH family phosphoesterase [Candidatus Saccharimonadia bacterium]|nr:DHH family phosphoesterase [Candidatus Saccharimonadia bacterium]